MDAEEVVAFQSMIRDVHVDPTLRHYILDITEATRRHPWVALGASPRGSLNLMFASQGLAAVAGREYVTPDDIKQMAAPVLAHRVIIRPEQRIKGTNAQTCITEILQRTPVPVGAAAR